MKTETSSGYLKAAQLGLIAGIVAMLICLVGMVQEFNEKDIIAGVITLGQTVIVVVFLMAGYSAAGKLTQSRLGQTLAGALAGFLTAGVLAVMVIIIDLYPEIRQILLNASPQLVEILTLGKGLNPGLFYLIGIGALVGAFGGFLHSLPGLVRRAVTMGIVWVVLLGLLEPLLQGMLDGFPSVQEALVWMFGKGMEEGLSVTGAVLVFMIVTGSTYERTQRPSFLDFGRFFSQFPGFHFLISLDQKQYEDFGWLPFGVPDPNSTFPSPTVSLPRGRNFLEGD